MKELGIRKIPKCELMPFGAKLAEDITDKGWSEIGRKLCQLSACSQWWIGDWLLFGKMRRDSNRGDRIKWGERLKVAVEFAELYGLSPETIRQCIWVSQKIPFVLRGTNLSWGHYREVAALDDQQKEAWLKRAYKGDGVSQWSVARLRLEIRRNGTANNNNEPDPGLFQWVEAAHKLQRFLASQLQEQPIGDWPESRREAAKKELAPIVEIYQQL